MCENKCFIDFGYGYIRQVFNIGVKFIHLYLFMWCEWFLTPNAGI